MEPSHRKSGASSSPGDWRRALRQATPYLSLGLQLAVTMCFFVFGGYLLDQWLGTLPWLTVAGGGVGLMAVFVQVLRVAGELGEEEQERREKRRTDEDF